MQNELGFHITLYILLTHVKFTQFKFVSFPYEYNSSLLKQKIFAIFFIYLSTISYTYINVLPPNSLFMDKS